MRDAATTDVDQILEVAGHLNSVNLPAERPLIEESVGVSKRSFDGTLPLEDREYMFVLEDLAVGKVIGTSIVHAQHGTRRSPHVFLQLVKEERYSESLDRYLVHEGLQIGYNYDGPTEIGGLILLPEYRGNPAGLGKFLSYTRFLFIAMHRSLFRDQVISELLPPLEGDGTSRLWEHLGRRFTGLDYREADLLSKHNKEFIRSLFPHGIIYTALLPYSVQEVIGQVGPETKGVEKMLTRIGFKNARQIDPFDGGPHFKAKTDDITVVAESRRVRLIAGEPGERARWTIAAHEPGTGRFRAVCGAMDEQDGVLTLAAEALAALAPRGAGESWAVAP